MLRSVVTYLILLLFSGSLMSQEKLDLYRGNTAFADSNFSAAKKYYNAALSKTPESYTGTYNLGNTSYRQESFQEAVSHYQQALDNSNSQAQKAQVYHNMGNALLRSYAAGPASEEEAKSHEQKLDQAIDAYKNALRLDPSAEDTRYNLAYAQQLKKQQQQQQQENQQDQDQQDKQDQNENKDGQDKEQDKKEQEGQDEQKDQQDKGDQDESEQNKGDEQEEQEQKGQPEPVNMSPREAEQLLEAAKNQDQRIQMRQMQKQQKQQNRQIEKDW